MLSCNPTSRRRGRRRRPSSFESAMTASNWTTDPYSRPAEATQRLSTGPVERAAGYCNIYDPSAFFHPWRRRFVRLAAHPAQATLSIHQAPTVPAVALMQLAAGSAVRIVDYRGRTCVRVDAPAASSSADAVAWHLNPLSSEDLGRWLDALRAAVLALQMEQRRSSRAFVVLHDLMAQQDGNAAAASSSSSSAVQAQPLPMSRDQWRQQHQQQQQLHQQAPPPSGQSQSPFHQQAPLPSPLPSTQDPQLPPPRQAHANAAPVHRAASAPSRGLASRGQRPVAPRSESQPVLGAAYASTTTAPPRALHPVPEISLTAPAPTAAPPPRTAQVQPETNTSSLVGTGSQVGVESQIGAGSQAGTHSQVGGGMTRVAVVPNPNRGAAPRQLVPASSMPNLHDLAPGRSSNDAPPPRRNPTASGTSGAAPPRQSNEPNGPPPPRRAAAAAEAPPRQSNEPNGPPPPRGAGASTEAPPPPRQSNESRGPPPVRRHHPEPVRVAGPSEPSPMSPRTSDPARMLPGTLPLKLAPARSAAAETAQSTAATGATVPVPPATAVTTTVTSNPTPIPAHVAAPVQPQPTSNPPSAPAVHAWAHHGDTPTSFRDSIASSAPSDDAFEQHMMYRTHAQKPSPLAGNAIASVASSAAFFASRAPSELGDHSETSVRTDALYLQTQTAAANAGPVPPVPQNAGMISQPPPAEYRPTPSAASTPATSMAPATASKTAPAPTGAALATHRVPLIRNPSRRYPGDPNGLPPPRIPLPLVRLHRRGRGRSRVVGLLHRPTRSKPQHLPTRSKRKHPPLRAHRHPCVVPRAVAVQRTRMEIWLRQPPHGPSRGRVRRRPLTPSTPMRCVLGPQHSNSNNMRSSTPVR
ncbi:hypothetical protein AMAG_09757 [Allomyces macrogynus ATCC 38327]|uniref:PH domain-containing protein n=1 Tax=Allomyces macrogynus (strain ATCC 38327) TaxID=578462 RepID=A0A0L0STR1_ALLM3|nr:hypothetical protein AMAG_09757 [Allomyces macrogynus ATCC 38327]|eukprot:KNE65780.1 hypothetical protein AMAG_09757 [Allomyces macrogynus ATCC 38327]